MSIEEIPDPNTGVKEKYITLKISNKNIRLIKAALTWYQGDADDINNQKNLEEARNAIHEAWKLLNPS